MSRGSSDILWAFNQYTRIIIVYNLRMAFQNGRETIVEIMKSSSYVGLGSLVFVCWVQTNASNKPGLVGFWVYELDAEVIKFPIHDYYTWQLLQYIYIYIYI